MSKGHLPEAPNISGLPLGLLIEALAWIRANKLMLLNWWLVLLTPSPAATYIEAALIVLMCHSRRLWFLHCQYVTAKQLRPFQRENT